MSTKRDFQCEQVYLIFIHLPYLPTYIIEHLDISTHPFWKYCIQYLGRYYNSINKKINYETKTLKKIQNKIKTFVSGAQLSSTLKLHC